MNMLVAKPFLILVMITITISMTIVNAASSSSSSTVMNKDFEKPWFCHGNECPIYELDNESEDAKKKNGDLPDEIKDYSLRSYEESYWISTIVEGYQYDNATSIGFMRLFNYISGQNDAKVEIPMTSPVRIVVTPSAGPFCKSNFTISFYVPYDLQINPDKIPQPIDKENIFVEKVEAISFYVMQYSGFTNEKKMLVKAIEFVDLLEQDGHGHVIDTSTFITANYDPPFRLTNRHNEIWISKV